MDDDNVTPRRLCAAHKGAKPVSAVEPGWLCAGCEKRTVAALWDIARLWGDLELLADPDSRPPRGGGQRGPNSSAPTRVDILALMDPRSRWDGDLPPAAALLRGWSRYVAGERKFTPPRSVPDQVKFLTMNFPWLMDDRVVGEFCRDVWQVSRALAGVCGENPQTGGVMPGTHPRRGWGVWWAAVSGQGWGGVGVVCEVWGHVHGWGGVHRVW